MPRFRSALLFPVLLFGAGACDNVGRAFDKNPGGSDTPGTAGESTIQVVPVGGDARDGRPKVKAAFPNGSGWPTVVPVVIEFSESLNEASVLPTSATGTDGRIILRVKGTTQALPCQYNFVANGRVLVMRPVTALSNAAAAIYEVVLLPDARDADGVRFLISGSEQVLTDFQVNQATSFTDGRVLTTYPRDNARDVARESDVYVFFDRPANEASFTDTNMRLRRRGGADVATVRAFPLTILGVNDPRAVRLRPQDRLLPSTTHELVVDDTVTFGSDGKLDFRGRTPFASFDTIAPAAPAGVALGNPDPITFPNKINQANVATVQLSVTTAVDAQAGDRILARIYGLNAETTNTADLQFFERTAVIPADGTQTVVLSFAGLLGTVARPKFDDGAITFAVQTQRGSEHSGFTHNGGNDEALFDVTVPTLSRAGPPASGTGFDVVTDQEYLAFFGTASEAVGEVGLTAGTETAQLFATADDGRFLLRPVRLGQLATPLTYSLSLRDRAGNLAVGSVMGQIIQRGFATGAPGPDLTVEAYNDMDLSPMANATVLVDAGTPDAGGAGQVIGMTGTTGRATFTGLAPGPRTITVVRSGFHLLTLYSTAASFVSLPLRPVAGATATLQGNALFQQAPGTTVLVGCSTFDDANTLAVRTTNSAPTTIPATNIRPNRPAIVTAFGGVFEPTASPTFSFQGFQSLGADLQSLTPPLAPPAPGEASDQSLLLLPSAGSFGSLSFAQSLDFGLATGLEVASLVGGAPFVRVTASLQGFGGQVLMGVGFSRLDTGTTYKTDANWTQPGFAALGVFGANGTAWVVTDARDSSGRISRHRFLLNTLTGQEEPPGLVLPPQAIPAITLPAGAFPGSPLVEFADVLDRTAIPAGGLASVDVTAEDVPGRRWTMIVPDVDAAGGTDTVQFPRLSGVAGLEAGTWTMRVEARLWLSLTAQPDDFLLTERRRAEVTYSRGLAIPFTIQ